MTKQFLALLLMVGCCAGCGLIFEAVIAPGSGNQPITMDGFEGVIFTAENTSVQGIDSEFGLELDYWTPTRDQVIALESKLIPFLEQSLSPDNYNYGFWQEDNLTRYRRQYFGLIFDGQEVIYVNYFCTEMDGWMESYVLVMDGGSCFFNVMYDVETGAFSQLRINGQA